MTCAERNQLAAQPGSAPSPAGGLLANFGANSRWPRTTTRRPL